MSIPEAEGPETVVARTELLVELVAVGMDLMTSAGHPLGTTGWTCSAFSTVGARSLSVSCYTPAGQRATIGADCGPRGDREQSMRLLGPMAGSRTRLAYEVVVRCD